MINYLELDVSGYLHMSDGTCFHITNDAGRWHAWLAQRQPFRFIGITSEGHQATLFTVRPTTTPPLQWYAYTNQSGKRRERMLGVSTAITITRLRDTALAFSLQVTRSRTIAHAPLHRG